MKTPKISLAQEIQLKYCLSMRDDDIDSKWKFESKTINKNKGFYQSYKTFVKKAKKVLLAFQFCLTINAAVSLLKIELVLLAASSRITGCE